MATYPAESFYRGTIRQSIANNTSVPFTLKVSKIPTLTSGLLTISPNTANEEIIEYSGVDGTALTITVIKRGISPSAQSLTVNGTDYNNVTYQKSHSQNDTIRGDVNHLHIIQDYGSLQSQINNKVNTSGGLRTGLTSNGIIKTDGSGNETVDVIEDSSITGSDKIIYNRGGDYKQGLASELLATSTGLSSEYILGGNIVMNECVYISTLNKWRNTTTPLATIGATVATTSFKMYSSGNTEQRYTFYFTKTGTPQDLTFRIETDNGSGSPSGTLVNANAVLVTAIASITSDATYEIVLPASFNLGVAGTPIHFVFWQGSQAINASNYLSIGINDEVCVVHDRVTSPGSNLSMSRAITGGTGTTTNATWSTQVDCIADCQLVSINSFYQTPTVTLFEVFNVTDNVTLYKDPTTQSGVTLREPVQLKNGKRYELRYTFSGTLNNISGFTSQVNTAHLQWVSAAGGNNILGVTTRTATFTPNSSVLNLYISKSNATNAIKASVYGFSSQTYSPGTYPILKKDGYLGGFVGLTKGVTYYLSNTGTLSTSAGTVSKVLGVAINSTTIRIDSSINIS